MNIAFYCKNKNISKVDCSNLSNGNPGIGGTFYAMLGVAYFLQQKTKVSSSVPLLKVKHIVNYSMSIA
jgi:hypothetical protein